MTWANIKKYAAIKTALINRAGTYVDGLVSDSDLDFFLYERYKDLFMKFAEKFPEHYETVSYANTTANVNKYIIGGDAGDHLEFRWVGLKYNSSANEYTRCTRVDRDYLFQTNDSDDTLSQTRPFYMLVAAKEGEEQATKRAIEFWPKPTATVTNGIKLIYVEIPQQPQDEDSLTAIPSTAHSLLSNYLQVDIWDTKGDSNKAERALNRAMAAEEKFFENYQPKASDRPAHWIPDKIFNPLVR